MTRGSRPQGRITPLERSEEQDRRDQRLPCAWVAARSSAGPATHLPREAGAPGAPLGPIAAAARHVRIDGPSLFVALAAAVPPEALEAVHAAAARRARIYALVADDPEGTRTLDRVLPDGGQLLVRRVRRLPASFLLGHRGQGGVLFAGPPGAAPAWYLCLSRAQQDALWRVALRWFWHEADGEACWTGAGRPQFVSPSARPFDVPLPAPGAPVHVASGGFERPPSHTLWHAPDATLPPSGHGLRVVMVPPSGAAHDALRGLSCDGAAVLHADTRLPFFSAGAGAGVLELARGPAAHRLRVLLEPAQAAVLEHLVGAAAARPTWRFCVSPALGELSGPVWLPGAAAPAELIDCQTVPCGRVTATALRAMPEAVPSRRPEAAPLARTVRWTWTVDPPRAPAGAREDALVNAWRTIDTDVARRLGDVRARLAAAADHQGSLGTKFAALASALLGFRRTGDTLAQRLDELAAGAPSSLGPSGAVALLGRLEALEAATRDLGQDLAQAEAKAREDQDREQQRQAWQKRHDDAVAELSRIQAEHEAADRQLEAIHAALGNLSDVPEKDRKARKQMLRSEQHRLEKRGDQLTARASELRRRIEQPFEFHPQSQPARAPAQTGGNRYVPRAEPVEAVAVPGEPLAAVGSLRADRGTRYLVIEQWEHLDPGEAEARRLGAQLVAPEEKT